MAGWPGALAFTYPPTRQSLFYGSRWGGQKVMWLASPSYHGPVLIRGLELDGPWRVGFSTGDSPAPTAFAELQLAPGRGWNAGGWRSWPTEMRLRGSGCYGVQIDGIGFSEVITFRAVAEPT